MRSHSARSCPQTAPGAALSRQSPGGSWHGRKGMETAVGLGATRAQARLETPLARTRDAPAAARAPVSSPRLCHQPWEQRAGGQSWL